MSTALAKHERQGRRYSRKKRVAERYDVSTRTVERWSKDGRIPPPDYLPGFPFPLWDDDKLDAHDAQRSSRPQ